MPLEFWLLLFLAIVPILIGIYELHTRKDRKAARSFFFGTIFVIVFIVWIFFHKPDVPGRIHPDGAPSPEGVIITISDEQWTNAWPNMGLEPDEVSPDDSRNSSFGNPSMWVEGIVFTKEHTILHVKVRNWDDRAAAILVPATGTYVIDDQGTSHNLQAEGRPEQEPFRSRGEIRPGVTERLELLFASIPHTSSIRLKHPEFSPITVYQVKPAPIPVTISFCRPDTWDSWFDLDLFCDAKHVSYLPGLKSTNISLLSGKHTCETQFKSTLNHKSAPLELNLLRGQKYYVRSGQDALTGQLSLQLVTNDEQCTK